MIHQYNILSSWYRTRSSLKKDAGVLQRKREILWSELQGAIAKTPAISEYAGHKLSEFPIVTSSEIRDDITQWNSAGIQHMDAHHAAQNAERGGHGEVCEDIIAGYSTGTSGHKGVFLASAEERAIYVGQSLAKLVPIKSLLKGVRVLLFLRAKSRLYNEGKQSNFFKFSYQPLSLSPQEKLAAIEAFDPTILIAPSHVLHELAVAGYRQTSLTRCFYGAEPMGEDERLWVSQKIGIRPDPIYQATEGFLGFSCEHGHLHLNEDGMEFELTPIAGTSGYQITVTDLYRKTQPIVRVKLDDYIELEYGQCKCGFAGKTIHPISGRVQNLWHFNNEIITPYDVSKTIEKSLGPEKEWKAVASSNGVKLFFERSVSNDLAQYAVTELKRLLKIDCAIEINTISKSDIQPKRHRVVWG